MTGHLIHVGYPKAGSTFLQHWFAAHPQLRYAHGGVAGYRTVYEVSRPPESGCRFHVTSAENFASPHANAGGIGVYALGSSPANSQMLPERQARVCALLRTLHAGSRILIVTRGFRGMILSGYSQYARSGGTLDIEGMCRMLGRDERVFDYNHLIGLYEAAFGEANVIVLPYELLRDDPGRFVRVLEARLGLDHAEVEIGRVNTSLTPDELYWYPRIARRFLGAASWLGSGRRDRLHRWYARHAFDGRVRPLVRLLNRVRPGRAVSAHDVPAAALENCRGLATRLRHEPLYLPYAAEYLLDAEGGSP